MTNPISARPLKVETGLKNLGASGDANHNGMGAFYIPAEARENKKSKLKLANKALEIRTWETDQEGTLIHLDVSV